MEDGLNGSWPTERQAKRKMMWKTERNITLEKYDLTEVWPERNMTWTKHDLKEDDLERRQPERENGHKPSSKEYHNNSTQPKRKATIA